MVREQVKEEFYNRYIEKKVRPLVLFFTIMSCTPLVRSEALMAFKSCPYILILESIYTLGTGFPKKDARFPKFKNIYDLFSDDKDGKIM